MNREGHSEQQEGSRSSLARRLGRATAMLLTAAMIIGTGLFASLPVWALITACAALAVLVGARRMLRYKATRRAA